MTRKLTDKPVTVETKKTRVLKLTHLTTYTVGTLYLTKRRHIALFDYIKRIILIIINFTTTYVHPEASNPGRFVHTLDICCPPVQVLYTPAPDKYYGNKLRYPLDRHSSTFSIISACTLKEVTLLTFLSDLPK